MEKEITPEKPAKTTEEDKSTKPISLPHHPSQESTIHNGSAGAFAATENTLDEQDSDEDNDDRELDKSNY